jgi:hypothetical protein
MTAPSQHTDCTGRSGPGALLGPDHEVQDGAVLVRLAEELGLTEWDVDELVYDMVHRDASDTYNSGSRPELGDLDAFDAVHDDADEWASMINNTGLAGQVDALIEAFGEQQTERMLREAADSAFD